jgi:hypothetical protein
VGFAVHQMGRVGFGHKILSPAGVFTAELNALFTALRHIAEVMRPPVRLRLCCLGELRIEHSLWCMSVNNCAGAYAKTELR